VKDEQGRKSQCRLTCINLIGIRWSIFGTEGKRVHLLGHEARTSTRRQSGDDMTGAPSRDAAWPRDERSVFLTEQSFWDSSTVKGQAIGNPSNKLLGYIETFRDGRQKATDANNKTRGYFDPQRNATTDPNKQVLGRANVIHDQR